jgi:hypothetical protein
LSSIPIATFLLVRIIHNPSHKIGQSLILIRV